MYQPSFYEKRIFNSSRFLHPNKSTKPIDNRKKDDNNIQDRYPVMTTEKKNDPEVETKERSPSKEKVYEENSARNPKYESLSDKKRIEHAISRIDKIEKFLYETEKASVGFIIDTLIDKLNVIKNNNTSTLVQESVSHSQHGPNVVNEETIEEDYEQNKGAWYFHLKYDNQPTSDNRHSCLKETKETPTEILTVSSSTNDKETPTHNETLTENHKVQLEESNPTTDIAEPREYEELVEKVRKGILEDTEEIEYRLDEKAKSLKIKQNVEEVSWKQSEDQVVTEDDEVESEDVVDGEVKVEDVVDDELESEDVVDDEVEVEDVVDDEVETDGEVDDEVEIDGEVEVEDVVDDEVEVEDFVDDEVEVEDVVDEEVEIEDVVEKVDSEYRFWDDIENVKESFNDTGTTEQTENETFEAKHFDDAYLVEAVL